MINPEAVGLLVLIAVFAIATIRNVHMGALALVAAFIVGMGVAGEELDEVLEAFPVDGLLLLLGITYLFAIARDTGAIDWLVARSMSLVGDRTAWIPWVMYGIATGVACMGTPHAAFTVVPIAMSMAASHKINPTLMGLAMSSAIVGGGFAPTSLLGIITASVMQGTGTPFNPLLLFAASVGFNTAIFAVAFFMFGGRELIHRSRSGHPSRQPVSRVEASPGGAAHGQLLTATNPAPVALAQAAAVKPTPLQSLVLAVLAVLVVGFIVLTLIGVKVHLGVLSLSLAVLISLFVPATAKVALSKVDWSTILLLGGIVTYIGVLDRLGAIDTLGEAARSVSNPLVAALVICIIGALVSAFASTIGILGVLIPLALPLVVLGGPLAGTGLIYALAVSASVVDCAPFSTTGATVVAASAEVDRPVLQRNMMYWALSMVIIGPIITLGVLVVPGTLF